MLRSGCREEDGVRGNDAWCPFDTIHAFSKPFPFQIEDGEVPVETPYIGIFELHIREPMTLITDYIIAVIGVYYWVKLRDFKGSQKNSAKNSWAVCFLFLGIAAFFGGTYHGFSFYFTPTLTKAIWQVVVYSIGFVSFLFVVGTAKGFFLPRTATIWVWIAGVKLIIYFFWMTFHSDFLYFVLDYLPSLIAVLVFSVIAFVKEKNTSAPWLAGGVIGSLIGAGIQVGKLAPHQYFNHNDLYHVIQIGAFFLFFRGARTLSDKNQCQVRSSVVID